MSGTSAAGNGQEEERDTQGDHHARGLRPLAHDGVSSFLEISAERCWSGAAGTNLGKEGS
jgi:hypothetical protein